MQPTWYTRSKEWIAAMRLANPDMGLAELGRHCRKNYPFAERRGQAYKGWLRAMREAFGRTRPAGDKQLELWETSK